MKLIYLKSALKCNSFDVTFVIKIPFFRVSVTIEPGCSLLQFITMNCLINIYVLCLWVLYVIIYGSGFVSGFLSCVQKKTMIYLFSLEV